MVVLVYDCHLVEIGARNEPLRTFIAGGSKCEARRGAAIFSGLDVIEMENFSIIVTYHNLFLVL